MDFVHHQFSDCTTSGLGLTAAVEHIKHAERILAQQEEEGINEVISSWGKQKGSSWARRNSRSSSIAKVIVQKTMGSLESAGNGIPQRPATVCLWLQGAGAKIPWMKGPIAER